MSALIIFMFLFLIIIVVGLLNEKIFRMPTDVALVLFSTIIGIVLLLLSKTSLVPTVNEAIDSFSEFNFSHFLLHGVICFLLFAGASKVHFSKFVSNIKVISLMSLLTTIVFAGIYGVLFYFVSLSLNLNIDLWVCILLGCILSPTDPRAATGVLEKLGLSKGTATVMEGESLLNDGMGVALFVFAKSVIENIHKENFFLAMFKEITGAAVVAFALSFITFRLFKATRKPITQIVISLFNVSCVYILCEHFGFSGDIASVICGLYYAYHIDKIRRQREITDSRNLYGDFWEVIDHLLNSLLFVLIGLSVLTIEFDLSYILIYLAAIVIIIVSRGVSVASSTLMIGRKKMPSGYSFSEFVTLMTWIALKGGISLALVLASKELLAETPQVYTVLLNVTYISILFTVIAQGLTVSRGYKMVERHKIKRMIKKGEHR